MLKFAHPEYFWAFGVLAIMLLVFVIYLFNRAKKLKRLGQHDLVSQLKNSSSTGRKVVKFTLFLIAASALIVAWANPLIGTKYESVKREGIDILFAIDVSKSMEAEDIAPSRMLKAKQFVSNLIDEMNNDRIGLIVFAGNAYLQMPITVDYSGAKMYLKTVNTAMVPRQGTNISEAIDLAINSYDEDSEGYKTLVIITDGENHDERVKDKIAEAKKEGIVIHTVGVGSDKGAPIPTANGSFKKDNEGNTVLSKLNEKMLKDIAKQSGGVYLNASSTQQSEELLAAFSGQEKRMIDEKVFTSYKNHFPLFLAIAFVFLLIELFISEKKSDYLGW